MRIDQSFVRHIVHDTNNAAIVKALIWLAHILNLRVSAEGVETEEQCDLLRENSCDDVQAYYFGRPMSVLDFGKSLLGG